MRSLLTNLVIFLCLGCTRSFTTPGIQMGMVTNSINLPALTLNYGPAVAISYNPSEITCLYMNYQDSSNRTLSIRSDNGSYGIQINIKTASILPQTFKNCAVDLFRYSNSQDGTPLIGPFTLTIYSFLDGHLNGTFQGNVSNISTGTQDVISGSFNNLPLNLN